MRLARIGEEKDEAGSFAATASPRRELDSAVVRGVKELWTIADFTGLFRNVFFSS